MALHIDQISSLVSPQILSDGSQWEVADGRYKDRGVRNLWYQIGYPVTRQRRISDETVIAITSSLPIQETPSQAAAMRYARRMSLR